MKLIIKVDMNDADYNTQISDITKEQLERFIPVFEAIKNFHPYVTYTNRAVDDGIGPLEWRHESNWPNGECLRLDLGEKHPEEIYSDVDKINEIVEDLEWNYLPSCEYGFHRIVEITVLQVKGEKKYL